MARAFRPPWPFPCLNGLSPSCSTTGCWRLWGPWICGAKWRGRWSRSGVCGSAPPPPPGDVAVGRGGVLLVLDPLPSVRALPTSTGVRSARAWFSYSIPICLSPFWHASRLRLLVAGGRRGVHACARARVCVRMHVCTWGILYVCVYVCVCV